MDNLTSSWITLTTASSDVEGRSEISLIFRMYCEPIFCVISLLGNMAVFIAMCRVKHGFSLSVRFYYSVIAISELMVVGCYYLVGDFLHRRSVGKNSEGAQQWRSQNFGSGHPTKFFYKKLKNSI